MLDFNIENGILQGILVPLSAKSLSGNTVIEMSDTRSPKMAVQSRPRMGFDVVSVKNGNAVQIAVGI